MLIRRSAQSRNGDVYRVLDEGPAPEFAPRIGDRVVLAERDSGANHGAGTRPEPFMEAPPSRGTRSPATASRDLRAGVDGRTLKRRGNDRLTEYSFCALETKRRG